MTTKTMKTILFASLIAAMVLPFSGMNFATAEKDNNNGKNPDIPPGMIMTPFGLWDETKVHEWKEGDAPIKMDSIIDNWKKENPGKKSPAEEVIEKRKQARNMPELPTHGGDWNFYAWYNYGSALDKFEGTWYVPNAPTSFQTGDLLYTFISLETSSGDAIIQPVLQYGVSPKCGPLDDWRIASWMVVSDTVWYASSCKNADPNDQIEGTMIRDSGQNWAIKTKNVNDNVTTQLSINTNRDWTWAQVAFESYNLTQDCAHLPGDIHYNGLKLNSGAVTPSWNEHYNTTWCGMDVVVNSASHVDLKNDN